MTKLEEYFTEFESVDFSALVNIASGFNMFDEIVTKNPRYIEFLGELQSELVINRIEQLINTEYDHKYENPYDAALAVYVMALDRTSHQSGMYAAQMLNDVKQLWWTKRVINKIQGLSI